MSPEPRQTAREVLASVASLPAAERAAAVTAACGDDAALRAEVAVLLAREGKAGGTEPDDLALSMHFGADDEPVASEHPGRRIGPYELLELVGEGGFGSVWLAEQSEPIRRRVALKLIKLGMDTKQVVARFEQERQALALMDHPNIAKVLDAGTTSTGRPYFVMEHIAGVPLLQYCDERKLDTQARLRLFLPICQAVQHAHQKGVIHRDLKPSNILVARHDGEPVPKVIDFGIAKAIGGALTARTLVTQLGQFIGTPAYMSPEQADLSSLDIDTRTDIYSLGVVLYELLTGTTPFDVYDLLKRGSAEMLRILREEEPHKPSTRVSTREEGRAEAAMLRRSVSPEKLSLLLRGDLDWIVMKCLEKDRARRYETAGGLAADLRRHLANEPVSARPPSRGDRLRKFVRRYRAQTAAASAIVVVLVTGIVGTAAAKMRADEETTRANDAKADAERGRAADFAARLEAEENERRAVAAESRAVAAKKEAARARARTETVSSFVTSALLAGDAETLGGATDMTIVAAMERATVDLRSGRFDVDPETGAGLRVTIGGILSDHGRHAQAEALVAEALALQLRTTPDHWTTFDTKSRLGAELLHQHRLAEAEPLLLDACRGLTERAATLPPRAAARIREAVARVVRLYEAKGDAAAAATWRSKLAAASAPANGGATGGGE